MKNIKSIELINENESSINVSYVYEDSMGFPHKGVVEIKEKVIMEIVKTLGKSLLKESFIKKN